MAVVAVQKEAAQDKAGELLARLKNGVADLVASDRWQAYLQVQARFHRYSAGNVLLILIQRPDASHVAGFQRWKELGRYVSRGEKGVAIFAPVTHKVKATDADGEETSFSRLVGFRIAYVFDVSQTDGKPLPEHPSKLIDAEGTHSMMRTMLKVAQQLSVSVEFGDAGGPNGFYQAHANRIVVESGNPPAQQLKTLVHELAHATLHTTWEPDVDRQQKEIEAESAAYVVCQHIGLDSSDYSFGYLAGWSGSDPDLILRYAERIRKAANQIIDMAEQTLS